MALPLTIKKSNFWFAILGLIIQLTSNYATASKCDFKTKTWGKAAPGLILFAPYSSLKKKNYGAIVLNQKGRCLWQDNSDSAVTNFRSQSIDGQLFYSYLRVTNWVHNLAPVGYQVILDRDFHFVKSVRMDSESLIGPVAMDGHDFLYFSDRNFASIQAAPQLDFLGRCVIPGQVLEMKDGQAVFHWNAAEFFSFKPEDFSQLPTLSDSVTMTPWICSDANHLNSIQRVDSPKGYLISASKQDSVAFISRESPVSSWVLGGEKDEFQIPPEAQFRGQHSPIFDPATHRLLLFDNATPTGNARVLEFDLDIAHRKILSWKSLFELQGPSPNSGNVGRCGEHCIFLSTGEYDGARYLEYDELKKKVTFTLNFDEEKTTFSYRAFKVLPKNY